MSLNDCIQMLIEYFYNSLINFFFFKAFRIYLIILSKWQISIDKFSATVRTLSSSDCFDCIGVNAAPLSNAPPFLLLFNRALFLSISLSRFRCETSNTNTRDTQIQCSSGKQICCTTTNAHLHNKTRAPQLSHHSHIHVCRFQWFVLCFFATVAVCMYNVWLSVSYVRSFICCCRFQQFSFSERRDARIQWNTHSVCFGNTQTMNIR